MGKTSKRFQELLKKVEQDKIYNGVNDLYIELSGEILSQNE